MKCPECGKETPANKSHCQECGAKLKSEFKTCANGHQYSGARCPYCPAEEAPGGIKTVLDVTPAQAVDDKTVIEQKGPVVSSYTPVDDRTVISGHVKSSNQGGPTLAPLGAETVNPSGRKLVGFLVTYDLDPLGTVYNLYEGRNVVGRTPPAGVLFPSGTVSDKHAIILYRDDKFFISDELSTNGTFVNGESLEEKMKLTDRDEVRFGDINTRFIVI